MDQFPDVEDVVESGVTFADNATLKAVAAAQATGLPARGRRLGPGRRRARRRARRVQRPLVRAAR